MSTPPTGYTQCKGNVLKSIFATALFLYGFLSNPGIPARLQKEARQRIKTIENYIVYYGIGRVEDLANYDLVIIQPETLTFDELASLKARGTLVAVYLSIGEVEPYRQWYIDGRVKPTWLLGENENWGSYFVNVNRSGWRELIVTVAGQYLQAGYDGIFLDTVDTVDVFPHLRSGMVKLIHNLRETYPDAMIVQNRGFTVLDEVADDIDAVMFEGLSTSYDFKEREYLSVDNTYTAEKLANLHETTGLTILSLDYAPSDHPEMAATAVQKAREYGFIPAVSIINLNDIPSYGLRVPETTSDDAH